MRIEKTNFCEKRQLSGSEGSERMFHANVDRNYTSSRGNSNVLRQKHAWPLRRAGSQCDEKRWENEREPERGSQFGETVWVVNEMGTTGEFPRPE